MSSKNNKSKSQNQRKQLSQAKVHKDLSGKPKARNTPRPLRNEHRERNPARNAPRHRSNVGNPSVKGSGYGAFKKRVRQTRRAGNVHPDGSDTRACCLSNATAAYMATLANPTLEMVHAAPSPNPDPPVGPVSLQRFRVRGKAQSSFTTGLGFVTFSPGYAGPYNNRAAVTATASGYLSSDVKFNQIGTIEHYYNNSPYVATASQGTDELSFRVVGAVLRIRNVSNRLIKAGTLTTSEAVGHGLSTFDSQDFGQLATLPRSNIFNNSDLQGDWVEVTWHPSSDSDGPDTSNMNNARSMSGIQFADHIVSNLPGNVYNGSELIVAWENVADAANAQIMEWEAYALYEVYGTVIRGKSDYPRDAEGWGYASTAVSELIARSGTKESGIRDIATKVSEYVKVAASAAADVIPLALNAAELLYPGSTFPAGEIGKAAEMASGLFGG